MTRLVAIGDLHCGHYGGLAPPGWQIKKDRRPKLYELQVEQWLAYLNMVQEVNDTKDDIVLVVNGDAVDGNRFPCELIESNRKEQCTMANIAIRKFNAKKIIMTRGTPSHVGKEEDWEDTLAEDLEADIRSEQFVNIEGKRFYFRHKIGRSSVPYGKHSAPTRMKIWNQLKSAWEIEPEADFLCFSHVHYCCGTFDYFGAKRVDSMTLPALQTVSQYGIKECEGIVHFGMVYWDIDDGAITKQKELIKLVHHAKPQEIII